MSPAESQNAGCRIIGEFVDDNPGPEERSVPAETEATRLDRYFEFCDGPSPNGQPKPGEPKQDEAEERD